MIVWRKFLYRKQGNGLNIVHVIPLEPHLNKNAQSYNSFVTKSKAWIYTCEDILRNDNYCTKNVSTLFFRKPNGF